MTLHALYIFYDTYLTLLKDTAPNLRGDNSSKTSADVKDSAPYAPETKSRNRADPQMSASDVRVKTSPSTAPPIHSRSRSSVSCQGAVSMLDPHHLVSFACLCSPPMLH